MRIFYVAIMAVMMCSLNACADNDQIITFEQLPAAAQQTVKANFNVETVSYVLLDRELFGNEYEVRLTDGSELKFKSDGVLKKVDCKFQAVPEALVPEIVRQQVKAQFPQAFIVEWGEEDGGWKAELNNKLELRFNRRYDFIGVDD